MSEKIIVRQNKSLEISFWVERPQEADAGATAPDSYQPVQHLNELNPYAMLLSSIATCTALVVLSYARNYGLPLEEIELQLTYEHSDSPTCEQDCEQISKRIRLTGALDPAEKEKIFKVSHQCPVEKIVKQGIPVHSELILD